ncbi:hypothetical protein HanPI659440_Chr06g0239321 [Helianthus annuus]|nr:hypothetical protein HanPI659440_Chr06g0239321 [Helianthus annuus]
MPRFVFIGLDGYPSLIRVSSGVRLTPSFVGLFADPSLHLASSRPPELLPMSTDSQICRRSILLFGTTPLFPVSTGFPDEHGWLRRWHLRFQHRLSIVVTVTGCL